jgi:hypothetical protein
MSARPDVMVYYNMKASYGLLVAAVIGGLVIDSARAGTGAMARHSSYTPANAALIIKRAPNFGNQTNFNIYIDGQWVDNLQYGETYHGVVPAGRHLVRLKHGPHLNDAYPWSEQWIWVAPARTSVYTATWTNGGTFISLLPGNARPAPF